ncbi:MAG: cytochrome-c peroxidase [Planctomyces sp.]|jgi:cytochrome c peroxidase|nr:cytochrome-c peroxidase [Planctomyces sp.]
MIACFPRDMTLGRAPTLLAVVVMLSLVVLPGDSRAEQADPRQKPLVPLPAKVPSPKDNPGTVAKVELGRQLFFDPRLSGKNTMSCASCHLPDKAFGDGLARARGANRKRLSRNTPTLINVGFYNRFFWDGRARSLEEQALGPIGAADEMNQDLGELEQELDAIPGYARQFRAVFGARVTRIGIARALAAFQRTLVTGRSAFDRYLAGDEKALSKSARRGLALFTGGAGCVRCHRGPLLSDGKLYRLGVASQDKGLAGVTGRKDDTGKFRTPTLRNVAQTGPYMHDGSMKTLDEVVTFYYRGVPMSLAGHPVDLKPLLGQGLSGVPDIVDFLESLTGRVPKVTRPKLPRDQ